MNRYINFLLIGAGGGVFLFLQQSRVCELYGINPNFFLIFLLLCAFYGRISFFQSGIFSVFFLIFSVFFFPFLKMWTIVTLLIFILSTLIRKKMTGNTLLDFLLVVVMGSAVFNGISEGVSNVYDHGVNINDFSFLFYTFFAKEVIYNIFLALVFWFVALKTVQIPRRISKS